MADPVESRAVVILIGLTITLVALGAITWRLEWWGSLDALEKAALIGAALILVGAWISYVGYLGRKSQRLQASVNGRALQNLITLHVAAMLRDVGEKGLARDISLGEAQVILDGISHEIWLHFIAAGLLVEDPDSKYKRRYREAHGRLT
jgi:hypothetical protein